MPRQHLHACWCAREEELLAVVHVNEDISVFFFVLIVVFVSPFLDLSLSLSPHAGMVVDRWRKKKFKNKEKLALITSLLKKFT